MDPKICDLCPDPATVQREDMDGIVTSTLCESCDREMNPHRYPVKPENATRLEALSKEIQTPPIAPRSRWA